MDGVSSAVEWYRRCIHQKQREATTLSIQVGLKAQENEDPGSLIETLECLNTAVNILEEAKSIGIVTS